MTVQKTLILKYVGQWSYISLAILHKNSSCLIVKATILNINKPNVQRSEPSSLNTPSLMKKKDSRSKNELKDNEIRVQYQNILCLLRSEKRKKHPYVIGQVVWNGYTNSRSWLLKKPFVINKHNKQAIK